MQTQYILYVSIICFYQTNPCRMHGFCAYIYCKIQCLCHNYKELISIHKNKSIRHCFQNYWHPHMPGQNSTEPFSVLSNKVGDISREISGLALSVTLHFKLYSCVYASGMSSLIQTMDFQQALKPQSKMAFAEYFVLIWRHVCVNYLAERFLYGQGSTFQQRKQCFNVRKKTL